MYRTLYEGRTEAYKDERGKKRGAQSGLEAHAHRDGRALECVLAARLPWACGQRGEGGEMVDTRIVKAYRGCVQQVVEGIMIAQRAAAELRDAWRTASAPENARRAERDGGAVERRWRAIVVGEWGRIAKRLPIPERLAKGASKTADTGTDTRACTRSGGWTVARALIAYRMHLRTQRGKWRDLTDRSHAW